MAEPTNSLSKLKIISANVSGFGQKQKRTKFFLHIKKINPDIIMLCDTRLDAISEKILRNEIDFDCYYNSLSSDRRGVAILLKKNVPISASIINKDNDGNLLTIAATYDNKKFILSCIYGPNDDDPSFFDNIFSFNSGIDCPNQIIGGDFNVTFNHGKDNYAYADERSKMSRRRLNQLVIDHSFFDVYRNFHPDKKEFTWKNNSGRQRARLDMFVASECLRPFITFYKKNTPIQSDHDIIQMNLDFAKFSRGKGYWRHNNSLLKNIDYVNRIKNHFRLTLAKYVIIDNYENFFSEASELELSEFLNKDTNFYFEQEYSLDPHTLLEMILNDARCEAISYNAELNRREKEIEDRLRLSLDVAKCISEHSPENAAAFVSYSNYQDQYNDFIEQKATKHMLDRGISHKTLGEKPSSFFLNLEKNYSAQKYITSLKVENNGNISSISSQNDIELQIKTYYENLYTNKDEHITFDSINDFFDEDLPNIQHLKLSNSQAAQLEGLITEQELLAALKKGKNDSAPGLDGFTYQFYKVFWSDLKHFLIKAANHSFSIKKLPSSQSRGVISIIPKGNKDKEILDNWRPLTILNVFYKLISGVIAMRINSILDLIIHGDQSGFVPGRYIGDCLRTTYDVMSHAKAKNKTGLLLLIDFKKAYDSISFTFIKKAMRFFGFGDDMISWVDILLHNFKACIIHAGHLSELFNVLIGCRQGDPVASPLFLISIEILCIKLRSSNKLTWFTLGNIKILLSLYADDVTIFLPHNPLYLRETIAILDEFYRLSGLQLQKKKTQVCVFGNIPNGNLNLCPDLELKWAQEFELLGISFTGNLNNMDDNITKKLSEIDKIIGFWKYRFLTPIGKAVIAKSLLLSKINHIAFAIPTLKKELLSRVESKVYNFIWGKAVNAARRDAKLNEKEGGLSFPDVNASWFSFKISWLRRLENSNSTWAKLFLETLREFNPTITICDFLYKTGTADLISISKKLKNEFWKEVIKCYKPIFTNFLKKNPENILVTPLWNSFSFLANNKPILKRNFNSLYQYILYPMDIMNFKNGSFNFMTLDEAQNSLRGRFDANQFISLKQVIRNGMAILSFNFAMFVPTYPIRPSGKILINMSKKGCNKWSALYKIGNNNSITAQESKWEVALGNRQGIFFWNRNYTNVKNIFFDNRIKLFYYLIVRGTLRTNRIASHHINNLNPNCSYCNDRPETILHLFWDCPLTRPFIDGVIRVLETIYPNHFIDPNRNQFIFGLNNENIYDKNNLLYLYVKFYIWRQKFNSKTLNNNAFLRWLYYEWHLIFNAFNDNRTLHLAQTVDRLRLNLLI